MKTLKEELIDIYCNEFNKHNYYPNLWIELDEKLKHITKKNIIDGIRLTHQNGFLGFHLVKGKYPEKLFVLKIEKILGEKNNYFQYQYCEYHGWTSIFINPYNIGLNAINYNYDENGKKVIDLCYDLPENYYLNN